MSERRARAHAAAGVGDVHLDQTRVQQTSRGVDHLRASAPLRMQRLLPGDPHDHVRRRAPGTRHHLVHRDLQELEAAPEDNMSENGGERSRGGSQRRRQRGLDGGGQDHPGPGALLDRAQEHAGRGGAGPGSLGARGENVVVNQT